MRRISLGLAAAAAAVALVACGGDGDGPNGLESKTGPEVLRAAAAALREAGSFHGVGSGQDSGKAVQLDIRVEGPDDTAGTITTDGVTFTIVRTGGRSYMRSDDSAAASALPDGIRPGQWAAFDDSEFEDLSLEGLASDLESSADNANPEVVQAEEGGRKVVIVTTSDGERFVVSNTGAAVPLSATDSDDGDVTLTLSEFGSDFDIKAPPADEVVEIP